MVSYTDKAFQNLKSKKKADIFLDSLGSYFHEREFWQILDKNIVGDKENQIAQVDVGYTQRKGNHVQNLCILFTPLTHSATGCLSAYQKNKMMQEGSQGYKPNALVQLASEKLRQLLFDDRLKVQPKPTVDSGNAAKGVQAAPRLLPLVIKGNGCAAMKGRLVLWASLPPVIKGNRCAAMKGQLVLWASLPPVIKGNHCAAVDYQSACNAAGCVQIRGCDREAVISN